MRSEAAGDSPAAGSLRVELKVDSSKSSTWRIIGRLEN